jgi:hypothetical protein
MTNIPHGASPVYYGLARLLAYARQPEHQHSRQWVSAILTILSRSEVAHA